jgi:ketol-acid reductoisomerase
MREKLRTILADIRGGAFGARFQADATAGFPWMRAKRAAADADAIEAAGRGVRAWMPWLDNRKDSR